MNTQNTNSDNSNGLLLSSLPMDPFVEKVANRVVELMTQSEKTKQPISQKKSVKELSYSSGLSQLSIRNYIKQGKIKAQRIGRRILIDESQFEKGLEEVKSLKYKR